MSSKLNLGGSARSPCIGVNLVVDTSTYGLPSGIFRSRAYGGDVMCSFVCASYCIVNTIRVKRAPKPVPVKRRPPTARRFYFTEPAVPLVYIFVTSHVLANAC
jgi:hypothetical protein